MARGPNRPYHPKRSYDRGMVDLHGKVTFGSAGAATTVDALGFGITKPTGIGIYRCTLDDAYPSFWGADVKINNKALPKGMALEIDDSAFAASRIIDLHLITGRRAIMLPRKAADGAANTATAETALGAIGLDPVEGARLIDAYVIPDAAVVASDTDFATLTVRKRASGGGSAVSIATLVTDVAGGNWVQYARKSMTIVTAADAHILAAGSGITLEITKGGTGVQLPILTLGLVFVMYADGIATNSLEITLHLRKTAVPRKGI